jgi:hypothetical protein
VAEKRIPRQSAISEHVNVLNVLDRVLNTRVDVAVGEIIGVSKELSNQLANAMKFKSSKAAEAVGYTSMSDRFPPTSQGLLIKIRMECDGVPIEAIIDTGSQLNIVRENICKARIRRPIDYNAVMAMNDANGGEGRLNGIVKNVPLDYGSVRTMGNLFVGTHVPFDLLLGRPWQRGNRVTIDELEDGTYLIFKDPSTMEPRHKVLVTPDAIRHSGGNHDPSTWLAADAPMSLFVNIGNGESCASTLGSRQLGRVDWRILREFPYLEKLDLPPIELSSETNPSLDALKKWLQQPLCRILFDAPQIFLEESTNTEEKDIKEAPTQEFNSPPQLTPLSPMEIQLAPATVKHENELPSLFSSPTTARTEAEALLAGLSNHAQYTRNEHLRDLVLTSHDGLIVGHCTDDSGFVRTDLMLLKMALVTPQSPSAAGRFVDLDVQYGTGLVHFYPDLGGQAPSDWKVPYLLPAVPKAAVSVPRQPDTALSLSFNSLKIDPGSAIRADPRPTPNQDRRAIEYPPLRDESESDSDDEVDLPCTSCLAAHSHTCAATTKISIPTGRLTINCGLEERPRRSSSISSLPALERITDDSSSSDSGEDGRDRERRRQRWNQFRTEMNEELGDRERIDEWHRELKEARRKDREAQEGGGEEELVRKPTVLPDARFYINYDTNLNAIVHSPPWRSGRNRERGGQVPCESICQQVQAVLDH